MENMENVVTEATNETVKIISTGRLVLMNAGSAVVGALLAVGTLFGVKKIKEHKNKKNHEKEKKEPEPEYIAGGDAE